MKAVRIHEYGGPEVMRYDDVDPPVPGPDEVLVAVAAAGVNPADFKFRDGRLHEIAALTFPATLGSDIAGVVVATGSAVSDPAPGTRVGAMLEPTTPNGYAELVCVPAADCAVLPDDMSFVAAAAVPCAGLTGAQMVERILAPKAGDLVLVIGATGMVGRFAMQEVKNAGARVVAAVRPGYAEQARALGADEVVPLDGSAWAGAAFDGVVDTVGGPAASVLAAAVKPDGIIVTAATDPLDIASLPVAPSYVGVRPDGPQLQRLLEAVHSGKVPVPVAATHPLSDAGAAHAAVERGGLSGKVVLLIGDNGTTAAAIDGPS